MLGILVKGMGVDHVIWGTDSIWFGSPQWQIEALRRLEIPEAMRNKHGFAQFDAADGTTKRQILGQNAARLHGLPASALAQQRDALDAHRQAYRAQGFPRSNRAYGHVKSTA